jgi:hypothetical protein
MAVNTILFDAHAATPNVVTTYPSNKEFRKVCFTRAQELVQKRRSAGAKYPELIPVVSRKDPEDFRYFNLGNPKHDIQSFYMDLAGPNWRVVTPAEEQELIAKEAEKVKAIARQKLGYENAALTARAREMAAGVNFQMMADAASAEDAKDDKKKAK